MSPGPAKQFCVDGALAAAIELFRSRGFHGVSTSELTAAMGIGKKSLYDTFGCKRELFLRALQRYAELSDELIARLLATGGGGLAGVRALLEGMREINAQPGVRGCLVGVNLADFDPEEDAEISAIMVGAIERFAAAVSAALRQAHDAGDLPPGIEPEALGRLIVAAQQGLTMISRADRENRFARSVPEQLLALIDASATS